MIIEQIRSRLQNGFHPFTLELSNGKKVRVPHQDFIAVHPKTIVVIDQKGISHIISPLHVVSIDETARHSDQIDVIRARGVTPLYRFAFERFAFVRRVFLLFYGRSNSTTEPKAL